LSVGQQTSAPPRLSSELVAARIRESVLNKRLAPGDRLGREEDLAREFGVSRPTLREALRLLSSEYLIRASKGPGGGIFVAATPEQGVGLSVSAAVATMLDAETITIDELLETRMLLEIPLAGLAAERAREDDVAVLRALVGEVKTAGGELERITELDVQVHNLVAQIADNRLAAAFTGWVVDVLQPRVAAMIEPAVVEWVIADQHIDLLEAIVRGDPLAAERAMREHLVYLRDLIAVVSGAPEETER
jgi:GntR family transcriptional regulator, transcriptional repressor for pyruvate dehydrogenase complex